MSWQTEKRIRAENGRLRKALQDLFDNYWQEDRGVSNRELGEWGEKHGLLRTVFMDHPCDASGCVCWAERALPCHCIHLTSLLTGDKQDVAPKVPTLRE